MIEYEDHIHLIAQFLVLLSVWGRKGGVGCTLEDPQIETVMLCRYGHDPAGKQMIVRILPLIHNTLLKMGCYYNVLLLGHVSKIVSILLIKLSICPTTDTSLCYYNYPF